MGYRHPAYAASLAEFGAPRLLPASAGWVLERPIGDGADRDAMGCYPLFSCADWTQLNTDLAGLQTDLVSLALVTDPFGAYTPELLADTFGLVLPFKAHYVADCSLPIEAVVSKSHRKNARRALRDVSVEVCADPSSLADEWTDLYDTLIARHRIRGIRAFSHAAFAQQLRVPGMVALRAKHQGQTVAITLWYQQGEVCHGHLAAASELGYELRATYAIDWLAFEYFADKVRWLNFGAGAGLQSAADDGLSLYKRGWTNATRTAYFCGRIFDHDRYAELVEARGVEPTSYFPAYRKGEFA